ncbi:MAG: zinc ABC transporter substrate-binding protein [Selenomonadaceae bacterium]|nr:zinc ABC transporter substrate-binding protein [Selenomonadaceae bacterium]MBQ6131240.1 zinc ABC transporter substrate-binding protein [Selenomonadaceae bacterium]MBQ7492867.1 zinc ABC transporter substrate-binding protein [Selenomonadaceae bacterium]
MRMLKKFLSLALIILTFALVGCGSEKKDAGNLKIVTSFYPIYLETMNVTRGVEGVEVVNMTPPQTGCLHDYQLTPEDMKLLETADIFVVNGLGMESFLDKVIEARPNLKIINASDSPEIVPIMEDGVPNPHVWLSITYAIQQVKNISSKLCELDPAHVEAYKRHTLDYVDELTTLRDELHLSLTMMPNKDIVTFHEAFPYLAAEFGLKVAAVIEREPGTEPTPQELAETIEKINSLPVKVIFTEPQYSPKAAETIARETGAKIFELDPIVTGEAKPENLLDYVDRMLNNVITLSKALQ